MAASRRLFLILNGKAAQREDVRGAIAAVRERGNHVQVRVTFEDGDSERYAKEGMRLAREGEIDVIVAGGGDGTLNQVVNASLVEDSSPKCSFGLLPLGTANDFAHGAGLPAADPWAALALCAEGDATSIDVGEVENRVFVNLLTGGTGSRITVETDPAMKKLMGGAAYIFTGIGRLHDLQPCRGEFKADGFAWKGEFLAMAIGNGRMAGGGIELCPDAKVDDGMLDLMVVPFLSRETLGETLRTIAQNGLGELANTVVRAKADRFEIQCDDELFVNLDGEPDSGRSFDIRVRPKALRFHLPE
ncbi:lipid kinase YegS [Stappia sediminis]|uniref:lipid kinase YegS n=1 Tax=Stappia sediminis TaxID=2692190 RepID=UPI001928EBCE|nr:lipid kinase YegS [Stappia sediminis]